MAKAKSILTVSKGSSFSKIRKAKARLRERMDEILDSYIDLANTAAADGNYEIAEKIRWRLIEHASDEDGTRIVEASVDKPKDTNDKPAGPAINIGFQLGGVNSPKPLEIIEANSKVIEEDAKKIMS